MDRNPRFGEDAKFRADAHCVADLLWETVGTNFAEVPPWYLSSLRHEYADGRVSMAELFDRVDLGPDATYEEYREVFDRLLCCDPGDFPDVESVLEVKTAQLLSPGVLSFTEDFAEENLSHKVELFLRKCIATVYTDGVDDVSDEEGNPPNGQNNYLLNEDGTEFRGVFYDRESTTGKTKEFPFTINENNGSWQISY